MFRFIKTSSKRSQKIYKIILFIILVIFFLPMPSQEEINQAISRIKQDIVICEKGWKDNYWYCGGTYLPPSVWSYMLDLMLIINRDTSHFPR